MKTLVETYKGYQIRKSGSTLYKVIQDGKQPFFQRFTSVAAARVAIDSQGRVMTAEEHAIMYPGYQAWANGK